MSGTGFVPDAGRRELMNALLLGSIVGHVAVLPAVLISYLTPAKAGGSGSGSSAKDALGNDVKVAEWLKANGPGAHKLVQGLNVSFLPIPNATASALFASVKKMGNARYQYLQSRDK